jgi:hypothetical protein
MSASPSWDTVRGERMNYVEEIKRSLSFYGYGDEAEAAKTHKELCRFLQARLDKSGENAHLSMDFLRGPRSGELENAMKRLKDDIEIFRDEVSSSYIEWRFPKAPVMRDIVDKDIQLVRNISVVQKLTDEIREAALNRSLPIMLQKATEANDLLSKLAYLFSDRERLCRS